MVNQEQLAGIEKFINYDTNNFDSNRIITTSSDASVQALKESIEDIENMIKNREQLHQDIVQDIEKTEMEISNFLNKIPLQDEHSRDNLFLFKSKAIEISQAKRQERLNCWLDIAKLKEELRRHKQEFTEKEKRQEMLDSIIK